MDTLEEENVDDDLEDDIEDDNKNIFLHKNFEKTVLSIFWRNGKLGAAVFLIDSLEIHLLQDIADVRPSFQVYHHLLLEIRPTTIITSKTLSAMFLDFVESSVREINKSIHEIRDTEHHQIKLEFLSNKHFHYDKCKARIMKMNIMDKMKNLLEENRWYFLHSLINFNSKMMISALGALLHFLDTFVSKVMLQIPSQHILSVKILNLESLVFIDHESYRALEIFAPSKGSSTLKWSCANIKKSFSLHSIFNRCTSSVGTQYMRILMSHPIKDLERLRQRHQVIEFFLNPENQFVRKNLQECLKNIFNINNIVVRIIGTQASPKQWKTYYKTVHNALIIGETCRSYRNEAVLFKEVSDCLHDSMYIITHLIETFLDFPASENMGRFTVKEGAVPELDAIKEKYKNLPEVMETVATMELTELPDNIESCSLVYMPEIGYLLAIPAWKKNITEDDLRLPNMEFKFVLNDVIHYKTVRCAEMDNTLGDSHLIILKHETEIQYQIVSYIQNHVTPLSVILEKIKFLDCLIAISEVAREYDLCKPILLRDEHLIDIKKGRHLLTQQCVNSFISNDFVSSSEQSLIKIITGPNSCGKSVYLKQVALTVYLAHIGSFVPAEKATMGVVDSIHTRIQSTDSVTTELSSFLLDLRQMYSSIYNSNVNSLIVIDEFGRGTTDIDGLSILYSCIRHFMERNIYCPHILVATHFHSIISVLPPSPLVKSQTFEFMIENESIIYLYKIKDGSIGNSFARLAALSVGLQKRIVSRADEIIYIIQSEYLEPKPLPEHFRTFLMQRRTECLQEICNRDIENIDDENLRDIRNLLNSVRF